MLVLSRKKSEKVILTVPPTDTPMTIEVTVADLRGDKVRLGFTADPLVRVHREEVQHAIALEGERRAQ